MLDAQYDFPHSTDVMKKTIFARPIRLHCKQKSCRIIRARKKKTTGNNQVSENFHHQIKKLLENQDYIMRDVKFEAHTNHYTGVAKLMCEMDGFKAARRRLSSLTETNFNFYALKSVISRER